MGGVIVSPSRSIWLTMTTTTTTTSTFFPETINRGNAVFFLFIFFLCFSGYFLPSIFLFPSPRPRFQLDRVTTHATCRYVRPTNTRKNIYTHTYLYVHVRVFSLYFWLRSLDGKQRTGCRRRGLLLLIGISD